MVSERFTEATAGVLVQPGYNPNTTLKPAWIWLSIQVPGETAQVEKKEILLKEKEEIRKSLYSMCIT